MGYGSCFLFWVGNVEYSPENEKGEDVVLLRFACFRQMTGWQAMIDILCRPEEESKAAIVCYLAH